MKKLSARRPANLRNRYRFMVGVWVLLGLLLVWRAVDLHVVQQEFLSRQGDLRNLRVEPLAANRGVITDRDGRPLAVSTPVTTLWANPREATEHQQEWTKLTGNKVLDSKTLAQRVLPNAHREFVYLARHLAPEQAQEVLSKRIPGIYPLTEYRRYYPAAEVTSHVVGFTNIDDVGQEGIELSFEKALRAELGSKRVVRDLRARVIQNIEIIEQPKAGDDVALSIDLRVQYLAYRELLAATTRHRASSGSVVVLDARTGEVLAMVNQPGYNPNNRADITPSMLRNRAVTDLFEPGSTIKTFTMAAALESGLVDVDSMIDVSPGILRVGSNTVRDIRNYGVVDIRTAFARSSNVATSKLALSMENQFLQMTLENLGFGEPTGITFPGESRGVMPVRTRWRDIELATLSFGYGLSSTALQLAQAYAVVANRGEKVPMSLLRVDEVPQGERILSEKTADKLVSLLGSVVSGGGRRAAVDGYVVGGKTGTVRKSQAGGYAEDRYVSLFAGVAPLNDPRYVAVVVIDDPQNDAYYGGEVAAPVFSRVMEGVLRTYNAVPELPSGTYAGGRVISLEREDRS